MKKLGKSSFEENATSWTFVDEQKDDQTLTHEIATYFANIRSHFTPVN